jgi:hypothetical protein
MNRWEEHDPTDLEELINWAPKVVQLGGHDRAGRALPVIVGSHALRPKNHESKQQFRPASSCRPFV